MRAILIFLMLCSCAFASTTASRQYNFVDDRNNIIPITSSRVDAELDNIITKLNQKAIIKTTAPSAPIAGMLWYDSINKKLKEYRNNEWVGIGNTISGSVVGTPQEGDVWYNSTSNQMSVYNGINWDFASLPSTGINWNEGLLKVDDSVMSWGSVDVTKDISGVVPVANGGTGQSTVQNAINSLTSVSSATNEHILTKDTSTGNAIFKAAPSQYLNLVSTTSVTNGTTTGNISFTSSKNYLVIFKFTITGSATDLKLNFNASSSSHSYVNTGYTTAGSASNNSSTSDGYILLGKASLQPNEDISGNLYLKKSLYSSNVQMEHGQIMTYLSNSVGVWNHVGDFNNSNATSFVISASQNFTGSVLLYEIVQ